VKLLEAFASGIPVVSTALGAEGLARMNGEFCLLADEPGAFADSVIRVLEDSAFAGELAARARSEVERNWDMAVITERLVERYRTLIFDKRSPGGQSARTAQHATPALQSHVGRTDPRFGFLPQDAHVRPNDFKK
jgi:hypothetical protein